MSQFGGWNAAAPQPFAYSPGPPATALAGVRSRRIFALLIDLVAVGFLAVIFFVILLVLGLVTFGLTWFLIPPLFPAIAILYNGLTLSGWRRGTLGMHAMDLEVRLMDGARVPFINAAAHVVLFYLSWTILTPLVLLVSLFTRDKRCLHDIAAGVIVIRRLP
ncbi:MAG TPA: RDD family protein [Beijerinckiaceae bacterium]|jgi:uncharacterized RDD family membrane protein YckC|nr:RDD family protein [Beijerinckiaceae bacterium]